MSYAIPRTEWSRELSALAQLYAGSVTSVEEDSSETGAQIQVLGYRLQGLSYDQKDTRVQVMLRQTNSMNHLTRDIEHVSAIEVQRRADDGSATVRIAHDDAQTLITLERPPARGGHR